MQAIYANSATIMSDASMTQNFDKFWLEITAIVVGSVGSIFFLGTMEFSAEPARLTLDLLSCPVDQTQSYASPDTRFSSASPGRILLGATVAQIRHKLWKVATPYTRNHPRLPTIHTVSNYSNASGKLLTARK